MNKVIKPTFDLSKKTKILDQNRMEKLHTISFFFFLIITRFEYVGSVSFQVNVNWYKKRLSKNGSTPTWFDALAE